MVTHPDDLPKRAHSPENREENDDDEQPNDLFALLGADHLSHSTTSAAAGLHHMPTALSHPSEDLAGMSLGGDSMYSDVYRSVQALDLSSQSNMATAGAAHLDVPFEPATHVQSPDAPLEPQPRAFTALPISPTHLHVHKPFAELVQLLERELRADDTDAGFERARCEWRGVVYPQVPRPSALFAVYPSSCPELGRDRFLLEFVRLNGCALAFHGMFKRVERALATQRVATRADGDFMRPHELDALQSSGAITLFASRSSSSSSAHDDGAELPRLALSRSSSAGSALAQHEQPSLLAAATDEQLYGPLMDMAAAPFVDIHVQGLALLAQEATKDAARLAAACPAVAKLVADHLRASGSAEVRRLCCITLAALAPVCAAELVASGAPAALARVAAAPAGVAGAETQRQAARGLAIMCGQSEAAKAAVLAAVAGMREQFDAIASANSDPRLAASIDGVRAALAA